MRAFIDGEWQDGEVRGLTFLAGERGMGKTTETIRLVDQCRGAVVFFDTVGTHAEQLTARGWVVATSARQFSEYVRANLGRRVRVVCVPQDEHAEKFLRWVCLLLRHVAKHFGGVVLAVDEIDQFCDPQFKHGIPMELYNLAHFGRHYRVSMLCTARDPATLSIRFRSQCAEMRIFRTSEERYVKYFSARIGKQNAAKLPTLEKTKFLHWRAGVLDAPIAGGWRSL